MSWRVEILNEAVAAEIGALPADMQARFLRLADRIGAAGLESLGEPHVKHLEGKLWELRLTGRDGIARALYVTATGRRVVVVRAFVKKLRKLRQRRSHLRCGEQRRSNDNSVRKAEGPSALQSEGQGRI
jgi:phage-related protein